MADAPDIAVRKVLDSAVGALTFGSNLFDGPVRPSTQPGVPHEAVFCLASGGPGPIEFVRANAGPDIKNASVQVRVRSEVGDHTGGQALARSVWTALQRASVAGYMSVTAAQSEPVYLGQDDLEHHEWSVNIDTIREE
jgi:hypothetical protein